MHYSINICKVCTSWLRNSREAALSQDSAAAGGTTLPGGDSVERHPSLAENGTQGKSRDDGKDGGSPQSSVLNLGNSPASVPERSKRSRTATK